MTQAPPAAAVPAHVPTELVREFDHHREPVEAPDCFSPFDRLYGQRVFWSPVHGGFWVLTRAEDISEALHRPDVFSSHPVGIPPMQGYPRKLIPRSWTRRTTAGTAGRWPSRSRRRPSSGWPRRSGRCASG